MGPHARSAQFSPALFEVRRDDAGVERLWCVSCCEPISLAVNSLTFQGIYCTHQTKHQVDSHLISKRHLSSIELQKKRDVKRAERQREDAVKEEPLQRVSTLRQPTFIQLCDNQKAKFAAQDDTVLALLGSGIPLEKLEHPMFKAWLKKHCKVSGCVGQLGGEFPKHNVLRLVDGQLAKLRQLLKNETLTLMFDEWTDERGVAVLSLIVHLSGSLKYCIDVKFLEGFGPNCGVENQEMFRLFFNIKKCPDVSTCG